MKDSSRKMALGGMITALAVVIMCMGSIIPVNTYICPVLCILLTKPLLSMCGRKIAGCYYGAVCILSLLLAPDREAAIVYLFLGYYPLLKPLLDRIHPKGLNLAVKALLFTAAGVLAYGLMTLVFGMDQVMAEFREMGTVLMVIMVVLWDFIFLATDRILGMPLGKRK